MPSILAFDIIGIWKESFNQQNIPVSYTSAQHPDFVALYDYVPDTLSS